MSTALLAGAFGQANPGDEALLEAFVGALPGWEVVATSRRPAATADRHSCQAVHTAAPLSVAREMRRADVVVFAGGTVFKRLHPASGRRALSLLGSAAALAAGARAGRTALALVGVGADDLRSRPASFLARRIVSASRLTVLRDEESATALAGTGAALPFRVGADAAWAVVGEGPEATRRDVAVVALSHLALPAPALMPALAGALGHLASAGVEVHLQPWQVDGKDAADLRMARSLAARLGTVARVVEPPASLAEARETFATARVVVGLRFHALVAAAAAGTPFVAVAHEPKLAGLARRFEQPAVDPRGAALAGALDEALARALTGPVPRPSVVRAQQAAAEEGFRLLRLVASGGRAEDLDTLTGLPLVPDPWRL